MSTETEEILEYAAKQFGSQQVETAMVETKVDESLQQTTTDAAMAQVDDTNKQPEIQEEEVKQPDAAADVEETKSVTEPDYNKWLSEQTGGLFSNVESFKESLPKISNYETVLQQKEELEKSRISYANSFVKELNELALAGAGQDQLKAFVRLNERGDLSELNPIDLKVSKLVLVDGYSEEIARKVVERDFSLNRFEEGTDEYDIAKEELRISSKGDLEALNKYKAELSTVVNPEKEQQEQARLQHIAQTEQHQRYVKESAPKIAQAIEGLGKMNLNGKEGDDAIFLDFPFPEDFKSKLPSLAENYFLDNNEQINEENLKDFATYARATYLVENFDKVAKSIASHIESVVAEKYSNKYENRSGLKPQVEPDVKISQDRSKQEFLERVANGR